MDVTEALEIVDHLVFTHTGKYLSDLERAVFIGAWHGKTYEDIYPANPEYVEKYVGYKLWRKLSNVCGEKVTKKQFRGALERVRQRQVPISSDSASPLSPLLSAKLSTKRVFLSCRNQEPDIGLASQLCDAIAAVGHHAYMSNPPLAPQAATVTPSRLDWLSQMDTQLQQCHYFVLLLSPQAAVSEMVLEELQRAHYLHHARGDRPLELLPIRVNCPPTLLLNPDLRNILHDIAQYEWNSPADTPTLVEAVLGCLTGDRPWAAGNGCNVHTDPSVIQHPSAPASLVPPSPIADPELPQGQVRLDSAFYIDRVSQEAQCYREILQPGTLIRVKAPRQMGKTSLMSRILSHARHQGYYTVPLSFQHADVSVFSSLNQLLQWFCSRVARKLKLPHQIDDYWVDTYGSKDNCTMYFEDCLLSKLESPLVLGLDEVDRIFQYPKIADDFFGLLRAWYEEAGYGGGDSGLWEKLRLVVVHSTEVYIPLDVNQSPFNVGLPIELSEFSSEQVLDLAQRHGLAWQPADEQALMAMIGGHPYLVRLALYHLAQQSLTLSELLENAPTESGLYGDHLRRHLWNLRQHPELGSAFSRVVGSNESVELESVMAFKLHSLGLVHLQGNEVSPRFELYRRYFSDRLYQ